MTIRFYSPSIVRSCSLLLVAGISLFSTGIFGCGTARRDGDVNIRVINGVPDIKGVDVFIDENQYAGSVPYLTGTEYFSVNRGRKTMRVNEADTFTVLGGQKNSQAGQEINLNDIRDYTYLVSNVAERSQSRLIVDDNTPPDDGRVKVRLIGLTSNATGSLDVYLLGANQSINDANPAVQALSFQEVTNYLINDPGSYTLVVTPANKKQELARSQRLTFSTARIYTLLISGQGKSLEGFKTAVLEDL